MRVTISFSMRREPATVSAPFPWFGGKAKIAPEIWRRLGKVDNYVEPFFGSGAALLANPHPPRTETICDADHFVANFWRSVSVDPEAVAYHADHPVNEVEMHLRHQWLITEGVRRLGAIETDSRHYDPEVAGLWLWGSCAWIGSGWCSGRGPWVLNGNGWEKPSEGRGINRQLPHLGNRGQFILNWIADLYDRMRDVRVVCGDWSRVCGPSVVNRHGLAGVFLDPPYSADAGRQANIYRQDDLSVAVRARNWAIEAGRDPKVRIAFAGYSGEHEFPPDWEVLSWKTRGGFGSQGSGTGRENSNRETLWFSPACLR